MEKPILAVTMGDPCGNGPELCLKAIMHQEVKNRARVLVIGDALALESARDFPNMPSVKIHPVKKVCEALFEEGALDVLDLQLFSNKDEIELGRVSAAGGRAAFLCVKKAIELALNGEVDGTVTNALNKEAMNLALEETKGALSDGVTHFDGHTEIYAYYTKTRSYCMMLAHHDLRVSHVSTHCSLRDACDRVKKDRIVEVVRLTHDALKKRGIERPKIAVCALNPHAGEHGLFGHEEIDEIIPAVEEAVRQGINAEGPLPSDSVFSLALGGLYDAVVAMYHDQGHIPLKTVGFAYDREREEWKAVEGVNITLGLPIIRTSVDHGTGFALAGLGRSSELSLVNAILEAARLV